MSDQAYVNALKRREELARELSEVDSFLNLYRRYAGETFKEQHEFRIGGAGTAIGTAAVAGKTTLPPAEYARMAAAEILEAGVPLTRGQLADRLAARSVPFPTEDVPRYLGTILWRNRSRFINVPGLGYAIKEIMRPEYESKIAEANARSADVDKDTFLTLQAVARDEVSRLRQAGYNLGGTTGPNRIPPDVDAQLLNAAGDALGRELYDGERIVLRDAFGLEELL